MVSMDDQVYILDFEVTHVGNPVFDIAFLIAHLLCKFFRAEDHLQVKLLTNTASAFVKEYENCGQSQPQLQNMPL